MDEQLSPERAVRCICGVFSDTKRAVAELICPVHGLYGEEADEVCGRPTKPLRRGMCNACYMRRWRRP